MSHDIMIDLETLGTTADSVILSIGAVRFNLDTSCVFDGLGDTFYQVITIDDQSKRHISGYTLAWWMGQSKASQAVFTDDSCTLNDTLFDLTAWIDPMP